MIHVIVIFLAFAFVHSVTVSRKFKHACRNLFGDTFMRVYYRALYNAFSLLFAVIAFLLIARVPDSGIWTAPLPLLWAMHGLQLAGFVFGLRAFEHLDAGEFMGLTQVLRYLARRETGGNLEGLTRKELVTTGVYGIVRHPLYLAGIVLFTFNPHITVNSLIVTVLADLYFLFGMFVEERRFLELFGEDYRKYSERVPRLAPRIIRRRGR